jgi:hypothetical protein
LFKIYFAEVGLVNKYVNSQIIFAKCKSCNFALQQYQFLSQSKKASMTIV